MRIQLRIYMLVEIRWFDWLDTVYEVGEPEESENIFENPIVEKEYVSLDVPLDNVEEKRLKRISAMKIPMKLKASRNQIAWR